MPKDDFYIPNDTDALRMENELLAFEVRFLKTQLAQAGRLESQLEESERRLEESERRYERRLEESERRYERRLEESERSMAQLRDRLAEAESAEQDLVLLLRRIANSPLGWYFGSKQNFRILEQRYLGNDG